MTQSIILEDGKVGDTWQITSTDAVQNLGDDSFIVMQVSGKNIVALMITLEDDNIRWAVGANPSQAGAGHLLAKDGAPFMLRGIGMIEDFRFISATAGNHGTIKYTPFYNY